MATRFGPVIATNPTGERGGEKRRGRVKGKKNRVARLGFISLGRVALRLPLNFA